ncbi:hypothetical protein Clacol_001194 [Clathrus columnatus]|uniref:F-box domain-containing protein n=1 Tax=Clathrus columnatus TaxID=1419009 RepID=A0AAV5A360_9AGAM|nr:hypothetical protein Clacol_001194 [Clathrus columnatus]
MAIFHQLPSEILISVVEHIGNRDDLLAFALTCHTLCQIIIPDYLDYFRISSTRNDLGRWSRLLQSLRLFKNTRELILEEATLRIHSRTTSRLHEGLLHMTNVRRAKFGCTLDLGHLAEILDALAYSKCTLEEIDLGLYFQRINESPSWEAIKGLPIWTKFDLSVLNKLAIQLRRESHLPILGEITFLGNMLSNAHVLTHLHLTIERTNSMTFLNLAKYTWPNLENLVINSTIHLVPMGVYQNPSDLISFFKRHSSLTTLSLPSNIFPQFPNLPHYISVEHLPRLKAFSYETPISHEVLQLNRVLSPASARRLCHLTISEKVAERSNMDIYKELASLQSCCITSQSTLVNYTTIHQILKIFVGRVTNLQKIHLPPQHVSDRRLQEKNFVTLSLLRGLPNLTHLSGWVSSLPGTEVTWKQQLREFQHFDKLKFVIPTRNWPTDADVNEERTLFFRFTRDSEGKLMVEDVLGDVLPSGVGYLSWGGFYRGMVNEV